MPVQINGLAITVLKDPKEGSQMHAGRDIPSTLAQQTIYRLMKKNHGFTLVELMITLAVVAILISLAAPSFQLAIQNNRLTTQVNNLVTALSLARSEAIKRGATVTVCKSNGGAACTAAGNWDQGWVVFTDPTTPGIIDNAADIIRVYEQATGVTVRTGANFNNFVSYLASGVSQGNGGDPNGIFRVCDDRGIPSARAVDVNALGRARSGPGAACP